MESKNRKVRVAAASVALSLLGATSLGISSSSIANATDCSTIKLATVGDPYEYSLKEVLPDFTAQTGIKVVEENLSYDALQARLSAAFVSKAPDFDVTTTDAMWIGQYYDNGWIDSLNTYAKASAKDPELNLKDFMPSVLHSISTWRGNLVGLPVAPYAQGVMYRDDVFKKLGIAAPPTNSSDSWSWDKYVATAQKINGKVVDGKKMFGTVIVGQQPVPIVHMYTQLAASKGAKWFKQFPTGTWDFTPTMNSAANQSAAKAYLALYKAAPKESINYNWFAAGMRFAKGDIGMMYWWSPYFYLVQNNDYMSGKPSSIVGKYKIAALPKQPGVTQTTSIGGWQLTLPSTSACKDNAWKLIKWAASSATQKKMALVTKYGTQFSDFGRKSNLEDPALVKIYPYLPQLETMLASGNGKNVRPPMPLYPALEGVYGLQLNKILGGADIKKTLADTNSLFSNLLGGNFYMPYKGKSYDDTVANTTALIDSLSQ